MTEANQTAYPLDGLSTGHPDTLGLTKREYFAAMALQGMLSRKDSDLLSYPTMAEQATIYADALINALNSPLK